ncbi:MAG TPA: CxxxxCH/CxxCH domain-containing protein, partial [Polyangiaceae bacterium]|nr:CxxxxCH/CxxCH domain-containing protein [Polyangiaceae bacterium]
PGHITSDGPATLIFSGAATAFGASPQYSNGTCQSSSCHGAIFPDGNPSDNTLTTPAWTRVDGTQASCGTCHGLPPPPPHPYLQLNPVCSACHEDIAPDNKTFLRPDLHVDGIVTFNVP